MEPGWRVTRLEGGGPGWRTRLEGGGTKLTETSGWNQVGDQVGELVGGTRLEGGPGWRGNQVGTGWG